MWFMRMRFRLENFRSIVRDSGFEEAHIDVAFSPLADDFGILSDEEREQGVLLVDFGAGTTEFVVEYNSGVQASGVLQVGFGPRLQRFVAGARSAY